MKNSILFALALALSPFAGTAQGNLLIDVGQISLLPNQAGQTVNVLRLLGRARHHPRPQF
jgi:hypothetical protein